MEDKNKKSHSCDKNNNILKESITKKTDDYCIINGEKIEDNACSTILHNQ